MFALQHLFAYSLRYAKSSFFSFLFFCSFFFFFSHPLGGLFGLMFIPIVKALCEARVPLHHTERVYIQGWAESRHIMRPNVEGATKEQPSERR